MDRIMQPSRLNLDANSTTASAEWRHWFKTFENYLEFLSQSTTEEFQLDKLKVLVNSVTHQVYQYIEECESYDSAVATLRNVYSKTPNEVFSRHMLSTKKQEAEQSIDDFLLSLRKQAKDCNFKSVSGEQYKQEMIRDAFINGLLSHAIRQRLLEKHDLNLEGAIQQARVLDLAQKKSEFYFQPQPTTSSATSAALSSKEVIESLEPSKKKLEDVRLQQQQTFPSLEASLSINSPDVEKAEWKNSCIKKLWPFIGSFVHPILTGKVQKLVRAEKFNLSDFTFTNVNLGTKVPRIEGIKVFKDEETQNDEIIIEAKVKYDGDLDVDISLTSVVHVPAGIKDIKFEGILRLGLNPLINTKPLVGALMLTLIEDPFLEFNLTGLDDILDFPFMSTVVRNALKKAISALIVYPHKQFVKVSPTVDISRLVHPIPQGVARVHVINAEKLPDEGFCRESNRFVIVTVGLRNTFMTKKIEDSNNPTWNATFEATVLDAKRGKIEFEIYDDDRYWKDDFLGKVSIGMKSLCDQGVIDEKFKLDGAKSGKLHLHLEWFDVTADQKDLKKDPKGKLSCAVLAMYIKNATNITQDEKNPPDSYVKIKASGLDALKTEVVSKTNSPVWEKYFEVFLKNPEEDEVLFTIEVNESKRSLGKLKFPVKSLLQAKDLTIEKSFSLVNSDPNAVLNARLMLRFMKAKPASTSTSNEENFTLTNRKPKETKPARSSA